MTHNSISTEDDSPYFKLGTKTNPNLESRNDDMSFLGTDKDTKQICDKKHHHKRTNTQYSFVRTASKNDLRKNSNAEVRKSSFSSIESSSDSFLAAATNELKKENSIKRSLREAERENKLSNQNQNKDDIKNTPSQQQTKQVYLFYRTPSNKDNKKVVFDQSSTPDH